MICWLAYYRASTHSALIQERIQAALKVISHGSSHHFAVPTGRWDRPSWNTVPYSTRHELTQSMEMCVYKVHVLLPLYKWQIKELQRRHHDAVLHVPCDWSIYTLFTLVLQCAVLCLTRLPSVNNGLKHTLNGGFFRNEQHIHDAHDLLIRMH